MKQFAVYIFLLFGLLAQGQSSEKSTSVSAAQVSLSKKYAPKLLQAYQENAQTKVEDVFAYFQMLTDAALADDYKKEIVKNIQYAFQNQNPEVVDLTSAADDKIPLNTLIQKLLISEPMLFQVTSAWKNGAENYQSWNMMYTITRTKSGVSNLIQINQLVFLREEAKAFGDTVKNVTVTFLGKMD